MKHAAFLLFCLLATALQAQDKVRVLVWDEQQPVYANPHLLTLLENAAVWLGKR